MCLGQGCIAGKRQAGIQTAFEPLPSASLCSLAFSRVVTPAACGPPSPAPLAAPSPSSSPLPLQPQAVSGMDPWVLVPF